MKDIIYYVLADTYKANHEDKILLKSPRNILSEIIEENPDIILSAKPGSTIRVKVKWHLRPSPIILNDKTPIDIDRLGKIGGLIVLNIFRHLVKHYFDYPDIYFDLEWLLTVLHINKYLLEPAPNVDVLRYIRTLAYYYKKYGVDTDIIIPVPVLVDYILGFLYYLEYDQVREKYDRMYG